MVLMPVHWKHVGEVRALLERLESEGIPVGVASENDEKWTPEILRKIYEDCSESMKRILLYLSKQKGDWVYGVDLVREAVDPQSKNNIGPYMTSLTVATKRHTHTTEWPIKVERDERSRLYKYKMPLREAEIVQGFAS